MRHFLIGILVTLAWSSAAAQPATRSPFDGSRLHSMVLRYVTRIPSADNPEQFTELEAINSLTQTEMDGRDVWEFVSVSKTGIRIASTDVDVWDRNTLTAVRRRVTWNDNVWENDHTGGGVRATSLVNGEENEIHIPFDYPVVSDGLLNRVALGTLPLEVGYTTHYNSFVRREEAILTHSVEVVRTETVDVSSGRFDTYVVVTQLVNGDPGGARATWYVSREEPRVVVKMETTLPTGGTATVELVDMLLLSSPE